MTVISLYRKEARLAEKSNVTLKSIVRDIKLYKKIVREDSFHAMNFTTGYIE